MAAHVKVGPLVSDGNAAREHQLTPVAFAPGVEIYVTKFRDPLGAQKGTFVETGAGVTFRYNHLVAAAGAFVETGSTSTGLAQNAIDPDSHVWRPQTATHWSNLIAKYGLSMSVPNSAHLFQDTSGNAVDYISSLNLVPASSPNNPTYSVSQTPDWACNAIQFPGGGPENFGLASASYPNVTTTSFAAMIYVSFDNTSPAANSSMIELGGGTIRAVYTTAGRMQVYCGGNTTTGVVDPTTGYKNFFVPIILVYNHTASTCKLYTPVEIISVTPGTLGTTQDYYIGSHVSVTSQVEIIEDAVWFDAAAEQLTDSTINAMLTGMQWAPTWSAGLSLSVSSGSFAETGVPAALKVGHEITAAAGAFVETGHTAALSQGYTMPSAAGVFAETSVAATLEWKHQLATTAGSFVETGSTVTFGDKEPASSGAFTETGVAATLKVGHEVVAVAGSYAEAGHAATLGHGYKTVGVAGAYSETGHAATLEHGYKTDASAGSYALTGVVAALTYSGSSPTLTATAGVFLEIGTAAKLEYDRRFVAAAGAYAETGTASKLEYDRHFAAAAGTYALTGTAAGLEHGRAISAVAGAVLEIGYASTLECDRVASAVTGSFSETGADAKLEYDRYFTILQGTFAESSGSAALTIGISGLSAGTGVFALEGESAGMHWAHELAAPPGIFVASGSVVLVYLRAFNPAIDPTFGRAPGSQARLEVSVSGTAPAPGPQVVIPQVTAGSSVTPTPTGGGVAPYTGGTGVA